jgi:hypothetical protein
MTMIKPRIRIIKTFLILIPLFPILQYSGIVVISYILYLAQENPFCPDRKAKTKMGTLGTVLKVPCTFWVNTKVHLCHYVGNGTFRTVPKVPLAGKGMTIANLH